MGQGAREAGLWGGQPGGLGWGPSPQVCGSRNWCLRGPSGAGPWERSAQGMMETGVTQFLLVSNWWKIPDPQEGTCLQSEKVLFEDGSCRGAADAVTQVISAHSDTPAC